MTVRCVWMNRRYKSRSIKPTLTSGWCLDSWEFFLGTPFVSSPLRILLLTTMAVIARSGLAIVVLFSKLWLVNFPWFCFSLFFATFRRPTWWKRAYLLDNPALRGGSNAPCNLWEPKFIWSFFKIKIASSFCWLMLTFIHLSGHLFFASLEYLSTCRNVHVVCQLFSLFFSAVCSCTCTSILRSYMKRVFTFQLSLS